MNISLAAADAILARTLHVLNDEDRSLLSALDELPARFIGAVNMLIDVTASKRAAVLCEQARRCRRLAVSVDDDRTASTLMAWLPTMKKRRGSSLPVRPRSFRPREFHSPLRGE